MTGAVGLYGAADSSLGVDNNNAPAVMSVTTSLHQANIQILIALRRSQRWRQFNEGRRGHDQKCHTTY